MQLEISRQVSTFSLLNQASKRQIKLVTIANGARLRPARIYAVSFIPNALGFSKRPVIFSSIVVQMIGLALVRAVPALLIWKAFECMMRKVVAYVAPTIFIYERQGNGLIHMILLTTCTSLSILLLLFT